MKRYINFISNNGKWNSNLAILYKAIIWRIVGTLLTLIIAWIITGNLLISASIGLIDTITKILFYWGFEKVWEKLKQKYENKHL